MGIIGFFLRRVTQRENAEVRRVFFNDLKLNVCVFVGFALALPNLHLLQSLDSF